MSNSISNLLDKLKSEKEEFWNITKFQGYILSKIVKLQNPKNVLELGTSNGYSALWLLLNLDINSKFTTIEIDENRYSLAKENFKNLNLKTNCINLNCLDFLKEATEKYDFIFIDSNHKNYKKILELIVNRKIIENGGIIIFDNILSHKMNEFEIYVKSNFKSFLIKEGGGLLVINI